MAQCIDLKTKCFIYGYLSLVQYSLLTIVCILGIAVGIAKGKLGLDSNDDDILIVNARVPLCLVLVFLVLQLTGVIVLLVGLHKNRPGLVKGYLILGSLFLVHSVLAVVALILFISYRGSFPKMN